VSVTSNYTGFVAFGRKETLSFRRQALTLAASRRPSPKSGRGFWKQKWDVGSEPGLHVRDPGKVCERLVSTAGSPFEIEERVGTIIVKLRHRGSRTGASLRPSSSARSRRCTLKCCFKRMVLCL
jgi:hypothetical protein